MVLVLINIKKKKKTGGSQWRVMTKHGPLEDGLANHPSILIQRTPGTVWKGKKIGYWKMSRSSGQKVSNMLPGKCVLSHSVVPTLWDPTDQCWWWSWNSNTLATWWEELTHLKRPWCWARLKGGEGDDRGWDGWMASPTQRTWVWVNSGSWWWTGRPGVLQSTGSQRVRHDWATELKLRPARLLSMEWVAICFSRGSSRSRDRTWVSCIGRQILYH